MSEEKWSTYEGNIQAYRSNFLASQSIMIAVGAMLLKESWFLVGIVTFIALLQMWYIWFRVIYVRCIICDYHKFAMYDKFNNQGNIRKNNNDSMLQESVYVKSKKVRKKVNKNMERFYKYSTKFHNMRLTRIKIDIILPITMSIIWITFFVYSIVV